MRGGRFPLHDGEITVGRAPNNQIQIDHPDVGWRHCRFLVRGDACEVQDLRAGGTWVNGEKIQRSLLKPSDKIAVGDVLLEYRVGTAAERATEVDGPAPALLSASMLLYAFRALPNAAPGSQVRLREQIGCLVADLLPVSEVEVYLIGEETDYLLPAALARQVHQGDPVAGDEGWVAMPLHAFGKVVGHLAVRLPPRQTKTLITYQQTLAAVAGIGSAALENARELERIRLQNELLRERLDGSAGIVGESKVIRDLKVMVGRVAPREATVLILGESGTGKELVARAIHDFSPRREALFIAINCAALNENLLESELFGHEKGAFTSAVSQKKGKLELAEGGTVFLDEIGELAQPLQAKLLRVMQNREFERVGGTRTLPLDIRLVAATNKDLVAEVKRGGFREDLYHRLNVVTIKTPPLRDHRDDIMRLAVHFLAVQSTRYRRKVTGFSKEAEARLIAYDWPGNVRELENAVERAVVLGAGESVEADDLPDVLRDSNAEKKRSYQETMVSARRESILRAYQQAGGDYKGAAKLLGLHPNYLLRLVRKLGMKEQVKSCGTRASRADPGVRPT